MAEGLDWGAMALRTPMVRGTHANAWYHALTNRFGRERADALIRDLGLASTIESASRQWIPLRSQMRLLDEIERRFGDGSYRVVRSLAAESVEYYPSVRRYFLRALPIRVIIETGASAYLREFNHGRIEVEIHGSQALIKHFDWLSSPARCNAWLGVYEGIIRMRKSHATVDKSACTLEGDGYCGYIIHWDESA